MSKFIKRLATFQHYKPLLSQLVMKDIKLKYRRSFLGYVWSILNPLMIMGIMVLVFSNMFRFDIQSYPVYLIVGQTIFNFVSESTNQAMWSITGNAALLKKTYVPKYIFTLSKVTSSFRQHTLCIRRNASCIYFLQSYFQLEYAFYSGYPYSGYISFHWDWECF